MAAAIAVAGAVLAACGTAEDANRATPVEVQSTSYVTLEPETTTTTTPPSATTIPPEGATSDREQIHTIQGGDSLSKIAAMYGITLQELIDYNQITGDPNAYLLLAGNTLAIPKGAKIPGTGTAGGSGGSGGSGSAATMPPVDTDPPVACTHTIVAGENPSRVASKYGITFDILQQANRDHDLRTWFPVGGVVNIPAGAKGC